MTNTGDTINNLTPKQDGFCQSYIETGSASEAFKVAKEDIKPSAMVSAVMGKAKLHGLLTDKVEMKDIVPVLNLTLNYRKPPETHVNQVD